MSYKTELHCHTKEFSGCSDVSGVEVAEKYIAAGYTTLVVTNHFNKGYFNHKDHKEFTKAMFEAADIVRQAAGDRMHVLTGMEVTFNNMPNDFLVFGITEEMVAEMPDMFDMGIHRFHDAIKDTGAIVIQAHPFRFGQHVVDPGAVDGIEVFNGHSDWHSHNDVAKMWALMWAEHYSKDKHYILSSGTDHHRTWHTPNGGITTDSPITTMDELVKVLRSGNYSRITCSLGECDY